MEAEEKTKKEPFTPTGDMFYIFFRFYENTSEEIAEFKQKIKEENTFVLGTTESHEIINGIQVNVYVKEEDVERIKNDVTLKLYQSYTQGGRQIF